MWRMVSVVNKEIHTVVQKKKHRLVIILLYVLVKIMNVVGMSSEVIFLHVIYVVEMLNVKIDHIE
jgi:hypothetical protein